MDLEPAFLDDVVAHPHDPTPWLVFADWLEERSDPRGELVRLWQMLRLEPGHADFGARHARLNTLFDAGVTLPLPRYTNTLGMEFVWVPPGEFWSGGEADEEGQRRVVMSDPFWLGVYLVMQGRWRALMGSNPSYFSRTGGGADKVRAIPDEDLDRFPVERVSWEDVQTFLARLNESERSGWAFRLPSKDQWEYACRSPVTCPADCGFSFYVGQPSNSLSSKLANFDGNRPVAAEKGRHLKRTTVVGSYPANRLGLYDLHGNVWEWTDTEAASFRVLCGGSWSDAGVQCTAATAIECPPVHRGFNFGFRVARVPAPR